MMYPLNEQRVKNRLITLLVLAMACVPFAAQGMESLIAAVDQVCAESVTIPQSHYSTGEIPLQPSAPQSAISYPAAPQLPTPSPINLSPDFFIDLAAASNEDQDAEQEKKEKEDEEIQPLPKKRRTTQSFQRSGNGGQGGEDDEEFSDEEQVIRRKKKSSEPITATVNGKTYTCRPLGNNKYGCDAPECKDKITFASKFSATRHLKRHTGEKPHVCDVCGKKHAEKHDLKLHMERCGNNDKDSSLQSQKFKLSQKNGQWTCSCGKTLTTKSSALRHMRMHTGEKPFACSYSDCEKRFAYKSVLKQHMRTHTGERPFTCSHEDCGKSFKDRTNLKRHKCDGRDVQSAEYTARKLARQQERESRKRKNASPGGLS